jgi:hypothetical protein
MPVILEFGRMGGSYGERPYSSLQYIPTAKLAAELAANMANTLTQVNARFTPQDFTVSAKCSRAGWSDATFYVTVRR